MQSDDQNAPPTTSRLGEAEELRAPAADDVLKLSQIVAQTSTTETHSRTIRRRTVWFMRLCSCFYPLPRPRETGVEVQYLLPPQSAQDYGKATLVLDLDETLVHSSFQPLPNSDFTVTVTIDNRSHEINVLMRPGVNEFLKKVAKLYEVVIFTASMSIYADKVIDALDIHHLVRARLFRDSCTMISGVFVKNLDQLGRDLKRVIIVDVNTSQNSPGSYALQPNNALPISSWFDDKRDRALYDMGAELENLADEKDVTLLLGSAAARLQEIAEKRERERTYRNAHYRPIANSVPPSPSTHSHDHGSYNSPRASDEMPGWPKSTAGACEN